MNKTIKSLKEAEKGCGEDILGLVPKSFPDPLGDSNYEYVETGECNKEKLCSKCETQKQTSKTALQEMLEELNHIIEKLEDLLLKPERLLKQLKQKRQKIQEALGEK